MKKYLFFVALVSAALSMSAALPQRTLGERGSLKTLAAPGERISQRHMAHRAEARSESAIAVPFTHTLGKNTEVNDYLIVDANNDGRTWKPGGFTAYSVCMAPNSADITAADDWMISPAIHLEAGEYYTVSFEEDMTLNKTEDRLALYAGTEQTVEGMTLTVVAEHAIPYNNKVFVKKEAQFSVPETGSYYFGFHCTSEKDKSGTPKLCNFSIQVCENPVVVPEKFVDVPFKHTLFKNAAELADYTTIDADNDGRTWKPGSLSTGTVCMKPTELSNNDDWFISLPVHLLPGLNYTLSYDEGIALSKGEEQVGVYMGNEATAEAMTTAVIPSHAVTVKEMTAKKNNFTVAKEGYYYFGFHCTSDKDKSGNLKIANFEIKESAEEIVPPAAGKLEITGAPMGELRATVKYTAPAVDVEGAPLTQITKVIITTNWAFKTELTDVVPGGEYTIETTDVYNNAYNRFEAVAYIGETAGESALVTDVFIGMDTPEPPTGVKAVLSSDFKTVTLSWDPVSPVGEKGGYVDVSKVTYYVFDAFGSYYDPAIAVTTETSATFDYSDVVEQDFVAYQVTAGVDDYYSLDTSSNIVVIGQPEQLPFYESFANAKYSQMWVVDPESEGQVMNGTVYDNELQTNADADEGVEPEYLNSQDADNGFFFFMPIDINSKYGFYSTKISLAGADKPVLEFWYQGKGSVLDVKVGADGEEPAAIKSIDLKQNPTDAWTLARIDLSAYKSAGYIQAGVMLRAVHNTDENIWSVPFDNFRIIDLKDEALRVSAADIPDNVKAGETIPVNITVENIGLNTLTDAHVAVTANGSAVEPAAIEALAPGKVASITAMVPTSLFSDDCISILAAANVSNGNTAATVEKDVEVQFPAYPMSANFAAELTDNKVSMTWEAPEYESLIGSKLVEEDFEDPSYEPFTYKDFGGFTFIDLDGGENYTFLKDVNNPYRCMPMAYQLFSPTQAGVPDENLIDCPTHSGESMLVAWSCDSQNANLLISPELTGEAQTISFWARAFVASSYLYETFSVWVSYTDKDVKSFTEIDEIENYPANGIVSEEWTEYKVQLPAGAKYFAILHDAYDSYALFLDDFTFETAGVLPADTRLTGYHVYCNEQKAVEGSVANVDYELEKSGNYDFRVSACYNNGESRPTAPVNIEFVASSAGVADIADGITIECNDCVISISAPEGTSLSVIDLSGKVLATGNGSLSVPVAPKTVVLVTGGSHCAKVSVK